MLRLVVRRLLLLVPILVGLSIVVFVGVRSLPGGPAQALLGERATQNSVADIEAQLGLDKPLPVQYWRYVKTLANFDLTSVTTRRPVIDEISERFPATIQLTIAAMLFAILIGVPLGVLAAKRHRSWVDRGTLVVSLVGISIPIFMLGILLKYVFSVKLGWLPTVGQIDVTRDLDHPTNLYLFDAVIAGDGGALWDVIKHLILPAVALGSIPLAVITRITRAAVLDVQNEDYVRTARAKGLAPHVVDRRHILRNAMLPVSTVIGLQTGLLLSGAILTERVFAYPGIGQWLADAIRDRNYPVLQGGIVFVGLVFVLVNLLVDVSYALLNPRIRVS
jgi:peptide/nickel transport system permease protein